MRASWRRGASIHIKMLYDQLLRYVKPIGADVGNRDENCAGITMEAEKDGNCAGPMVEAGEDKKFSVSGNVDSELCLQVMRSIGDMALLWESYDVAFYSRLLCVLIVVDDEYWMNRSEVEKELPERAVLEEYIGRADVKTCLGGRSPPGPS